MEVRSKVITMRVSGAVDEWLQRKSKEAARSKSGYVYWLLMEAFKQDMMREAYIYSPHNTNPDWVEPQSLEIASEMLSKLFEKGE